MPSAFERAAFARGRLGHDIVALEQLDLVGRQQRLRQVLQERRLQLGERERQRHQQPLALGDGEHVLHQLA